MNSKENDQKSKKNVLQRLSSKKINQRIIAEYYRLAGNYNKYSALYYCGKYVTLRRCNKCGKMHIESANFCRDRFCPTCTWRRSMRLQINMRDIVRECYKMGFKKFIFITLTVPNVSPDKLSDEISFLLKSSADLLRRRYYKSKIAGYAKATEITISTNPRAEKYHPHVHILCTIHDYIDIYKLESDWVQLYNKCHTIQIDHLNIDVRAVDNAESAATEVAKYSVKDSEIISDYQTFLELHYALKGRRFLSYCGIFKKIRAKLKLDDDKFVDDVDYICCNTEMEQILLEFDYGVNKYVHRKEFKHEKTN